jgi:glutamyl-tRNA(Gln) amidotransferase subunit D
VPSAEIENRKEQTQQEEAYHERHIKQDPTLPPVVILHTGGTIASKVDYATGAVTNRFTPEEIIAMFPEMLTIANISSKLLRNMASDDMRFAHYNIMARAVLEEIGKGATGVIITHGTDTMHYTAAALSFALQGLTIPVVLVGAQRSSDRGSSDASTNLMGALRFITKGGTPGVFIAMHEHSDDTSIGIIDGLHARKNHSSRRDAFVPVNAKLFARVQESVVILDHERALKLKAAASRTAVLPFNEELKIGLWKAHTHAFADELLVYDHYHGLIIEGTGLGALPMNEIDEFTKEHSRIGERVKHLAAKIPVVMVTQTVFGRVNMNVYSPGRKLQEFGVLGQGCDMPSETAFMKLAWLLSNFSKEETLQKISEDIRGEIPACSPLEDMHNEA